MMVWFKRILIASFCIVSLVATGLALWKFYTNVEEINEYLGFNCVLITMTGFEGIVKVFMVIILAICLIKYGIARRQMGAQSL